MFPESVSNDRWSRWWTTYISMPWKEVGSSGFQQRLALFSDAAVTFAGNRFEGTSIDDPQLAAAVADSAGML
jgi:hypothetical protein